MRAALSRIGLVGPYTLLSLAAFVITGMAVSSALEDAVREHALHEAKRSGTLVGSVAVRAHVGVSDLGDGLSGAARLRLDTFVAQARGRGELHGLKLWSREGTLLYAGGGVTGRVGRRYPGSEGLRAALADRTMVEVEAAENDEGSDAGSVGEPRLEVFTPLALAGGPPVAAVEVYLPAAPVHEAITAEVGRIRLLLGLGLGALFLALLPIAWWASRRLRRQSSESRHQALHDSLTGLPNRTLFFDRLEHGIRAARRDGHSLAVLLMDFDRFKEINDSLGHHSGDQLLRQVAARLSGAVRESDTIARLGGDEFAVLLRDVRDADAAEHVAAELRRVLADPFTLPSMAITVDASVGIALFPDHAIEADMLVQRADTAINSAKARKSGLEVYDVERDGFGLDQLALLEELRGAIEAEQIEVHFQPKASVETRRPLGVEALARWSHPQRGNVPPDVFVPLAENAGLITPLTRIVLGRALAQCRAWSDAGLDVPVAVNISVLNLLSTRFPPDVRDALETHGVDPAMLTLEVTEGTLMTDPRRSVAILAQLRALGVGLSIDDFGVGHSSLAYISQLPVDEIKIDRSFVAAMSGEHGCAIVRSAIQLGRNLHLRVVAEGVEDAEALALLESLGCEIVQGFHVGRPMPANQLTPWLAGTLGGPPLERRRA